MQAPTTNPPSRFSRRNSPIIPRANNERADPPPTKPNRPRANRRKSPKTPPSDNRPSCPSKADSTLSAPIPVQSIGGSTSTPAPEASPPSPPLLILSPPFLASLHLSSNPHPEIPPSIIFTIPFPFILSSNALSFACEGGIIKVTSTPFSFDNDEVYREHRKISKLNYKPVETPVTPSYTFYDQQQQLKLGQAVVSYEVYSDLFMRVSLPPRDAAPTRKPSDPLYRGTYSLEIDTSVVFQQPEMQKHVTPGVIQRLTPYWLASKRTLLLHCSFTPQDPLSDNPKKLNVEQEIPANHQPNEQGSTHQCNKPAVPTAGKKKRASARANDGGHGDHPMPKNDTNVAAPQSPAELPSVVNVIPSVHHDQDGLNPPIAPKVVSPQQHVDSSPHPTTRIDVGGKTSPPAASQTLATSSPVMAKPIPPAAIQVAVLPPLDDNSPIAPSDSPKAPMASSVNESPPAGLPQASDESAPVLPAPPLSKKHKKELQRLEEQRLEELEQLELKSEYDEITKANTEFNLNAFREQKSSVILEKTKKTKSNKKQQSALAQSTPKSSNPSMTQGNGVKPDKATFPDDFLSLAIFPACTECTLNNKTTCGHCPALDPLSQSFDQKMARVYKRTKIIAHDVVLQFAVNRHELMLKFNPPTADIVDTPPETATPQSESTDVNNILIPKRKASGKQERIRFSSSISGQQANGKIITERCVDHYDPLFNHDIDLPKSFHAAITHLDISQGRISVKQCY